MSQKHKACIKLAINEDVELLAPKVRKADQDEIYAAFGVDVVTGLQMSFDLSTHAWSGEIDGELICLFGVGPRSILTGNGSPWLIGSDEIEKHSRLFLRNCRPIVQDMLNSYPTLTNWIDARNKTSIRWLRWLGFEIHQARPWGYLQMPFHKFEMRL